MSYVYDGASWREIATWYAYDGATWRDIQEAWSYDGATWRKVFDAVSCASASIDSGQTAWSESGCGASECLYCIAISHADCTDSCHHVDGFRSKNGGSWTASGGCTGVSCTNKTGTDCGVAASWEFSCNIRIGKFGDCGAYGSDTWAGKLEIQLDSDSTVEDTYTGGTESGPCIA